MAFGQQSGPPATNSQVQELLRLLKAAGHDGFREARGPLGFTQRQAGGKFTRAEADAFIALLESSDASSDASSGASASADEPSQSRPAAVVRSPRAGPSTPMERTLRGVPDELLAAELQRRGWAVIQP